MHDDNRTPLHPQDPVPAPFDSQWRAGGEVRTTPSDVGGDERAPISATPATPEPSAAPDTSEASWPPAVADIDPALWVRTSRGLTIWFVLLSVLGIAGLAFGQQELALFAALSGLFVASHAADIDRQWTMLHYALVWVIPLSGALAFVGMATALQTTAIAQPGRSVLVGFCVAGTLVSVLTLHRPFANAIARGLFRAAKPSHTLRLAARFVFLAVLGAVPAWFALRGVIATLDESIGDLIDSASLSTGLVGYVLLACAAVGFLLRRNGRQTLERLGVGRMTRTHALVAVAGIIAVVAANTGADWIQKLYLHDLWLQDQRMSEAIGRDLGLASTILLGLSAGIGEEITMRGALQPKLGIAGTSLLFACLHVQYTWYGIAIIFLMGILLGTIRKRTNTTVAMVVHAVYDMLAIFAGPGR